MAATSQHARRWTDADMTPESRPAGGAGDHEDTEILGLPRPQLLADPDHRARKAELAEQLFGRACAHATLRCEVLHGDAGQIREAHVRRFAARRAELATPPPASLAELRRRTAGRRCPCSCRCSRAARSAAVGA